VSTVTIVEGPQYSTRAYYALLNDTKFSFAWQRRIHVADGTEEVLVIGLSQMGVGFVVSCQAFRSSAYGTSAPLTNASITV
jgi:hypothetical protein